MPVAALCYISIGLHPLHRCIRLTRPHSLLFLTLKPMYDTIWWLSLVRYDLVILPCTIWASSSLLYDINLGATHTTILSIRGVMIPIYLVSSTTDSIRRCIVLFKTVTVLTSDPKSEFLCQSSRCRTEPAGSPEPPHTPGISPTPSNTTYHPYCHSPSALTEYLKQKLRHQQAKCLGRSCPTQIKQNVPLKRNTLHAIIKACLSWWGHEVDAQYLQSPEWTSNRNWQSL